ncbi:hypothetical protein, partial [Actinophytocola sp.]|uniref:hypothetical protein n=1 Tax=Actinophytocola sp. TaxID=1872138 RepID=UPI003D6AAB57
RLHAAALPRRHAVRRHPGRGRQGLGLLRLRQRAGVLRPGRYRPRPGMLPRRGRLRQRLRLLRQWLRLLLARWRPGPRATTVTTTVTAAGVSDRGQPRHRWRADLRWHGLRRRTGRRWHRLGVRTDRQAGLRTRRRTARPGVLTGPVAGRLLALLGRLRTLRQRLGVLLARWLTWRPALWSRLGLGRRLGQGLRVLRAAARPGWRLGGPVEAGVGAAVRGSGGRRGVVADDRQLAALGVDAVDDRLGARVTRVVGATPTTARCRFSGLRAVLGEQLSDCALSWLRSAFVTH